MRRVIPSLLTAFVLAATCSAGQQVGRGQPPGGAAGIVERWLECQECSAGELEAAVRLGQSAVISLAPSLVDGPLPAKRQSYEKYLRKMFADMKAYEKTHPKSVVPYSEDEFVRRDLAKYVNLYRVRAARALGEIGGPDAASALDRALTLQLDPYVAAKVKEARSKIKTK